MNNKPVQNISDELWNEWKKQLRHGDSLEICKVLDVTPPTITKAFKYGHVAKTYLADAITKFFSDRLEKEKADAERLQQLSQTQN